MVARRARFGYTGLTPFYETNMGEGSMPVIMKLLSRRDALRALENARKGAGRCNPAQTGLRPPVRGRLLSTGRNRTQWHAAVSFRGNVLSPAHRGFPLPARGRRHALQRRQAPGVRGNLPPRTPAPGLPHLSAAHPRAGRRAGRSCALHGGAGPARMVRMPAAGAGRLRAMDQAFIAAVARAGDALIQNVSMLEALYNEQRLIDEMRQL